MSPNSFYRPHRRGPAHFTTLCARRRRHSHSHSRRTTHARAIVLIRTNDPRFLGRSNSSYIIAVGRIPILFPLLPEIAQPFSKRFGGPTRDLLRISSKATVSPWCLSPCVHVDDDIRSRRRVPAAEPRSALRNNSPRGPRLEPMAQEHRGGKEKREKKKKRKTPTDGILSPIFHRGLLYSTR